MENASKALIIAGAILIAILLISVAVLIINSTSSITDRVGAQSNTMEAQAFNQKLLAYMNNDVYLDTVRDFLNTIIAINATEPDNYVMVDYWETETVQDHGSHSAHLYTPQSLKQLLRTITSSDRKYKYSIYITPDCNHFGLTKSYRPNGYIGNVSIRRLVH